VREIFQVEAVERFERQVLRTMDVVPRAYQFGALNTAFEEPILEEQLGSN
jgi:hypothetical protein